MAPERRFTKRRPKKKIINPLKKEQGFTCSEEEKKEEEKYPLPLTPSASYLFPPPLPPRHPKENGIGIKNYLEERVSFLAEMLGEMVQAFSNHDQVWEPL